MIRTKQAGPANPNTKAQDLKDLQKHLSSQPPLPSQNGAVPPPVPHNMPPGALPPGMPQQQDPRQALLSQMHDVEGYQDISWWPPAPGWWLVALLLLAIIAAAISYCWRRVIGNRYRKQALEELHLLQTSSHSHNQQAQILMQLLKRTFFTAYPHYRHQVAGVYGQKWLDILGATGGKKFSRIATEAKVTSFDDLLYSSPSDKDEAALSLLKQLAETWIKNHRSMSNRKTNNKRVNRTDTRINQAIAADQDKLAGNTATSKGIAHA